MREWHLAAYIKAKSCLLNFQFWHIMTLTNWTFTLYKDFVVTYIVKRIAIRIDNTAYSLLIFKMKCVTLYLLANLFNLHRKPIENLMQSRNSSTKTLIWRVIPFDMVIYTTCCWLPFTNYDLKSSNSNV